MGKKDKRTKAEKQFEKKHGFPVQDTWDLSYWISRELSKRLRVWAEVAIHSYPPDRTYEQRMAEILEVADNFDKYVNKWDTSEEMNANNDAGQSAIEWVAKNFSDLWD